MKFVHIADVHLGMSFKSASFGKQFGNQKRKAIKKNLQKVINHIKEHQIELLLIAGDLFESDYAELGDLLDVKYLFESIDKTHIVIMAGNHDPLSVQDNVYSLVKWPNNVHLVGPDYDVVNLETIDTSIVSLSWNSKGPLALNKTRLEEHVDLMKCTNRMAMLHGDVYTKSDYCYMEPSYLATLDVDYIALGHIHKPDSIKPHIVYSGSLEPLDFSENYKHGFVEGELVSRKLTMTPIESMVLPMVVVDVDITGCDSYLEVFDKVKTDLFSHKIIISHDNSMVRIQLNGEKNPYIGELKERLSVEVKDLISEQIVYIEIKDTTTEGFDIDQLYMEHKEDLIGHFIRVMKDKDGDEDVNRQALLTGIRLLLEAMR